MRKHFKMTDGEARLLSEGYEPPVGTFFDPEMPFVKETGRLGDVIEIDLKKLLAKRLDAKESDFKDFAITIDDLKAYSDDYSTEDTKADFKLVSIKDKGEGKDLPYSRDNQNNVKTFKETGRMYVVPVLTKDDLTLLRNGKNITSEKDVTINFTVKHLQEDGTWMEKRSKVNVVAKDIDNVFTFFGDRPLDNPGYSQFDLKSGVSNGKGDVLDVYRIEQRLAYLGFPAMGASNDLGKPTLTNNTIQDFDVDGKFEEKEQRALKLFEKVVRYGTGTGSATKDYNLSVPNRYSVDLSFTVKININATGEINKSISWDIGNTIIDPSLVGAEREAALTEANIAVGEKMTDVIVNYYNQDTGTTYNNALKAAEESLSKSFSNDPSVSSPGADGAIEAAGSEKKLTLDWINAYNAPHWMQFFGSTAGDKEPDFESSSAKLPGWFNTQQGITYKGKKTNVEVYGTSWLYDLMAAKQFAPEKLVQSNSWFNGSVDANWGFTPSGHSTHNFGMSFDLGVSNYISKAKGGAQEKGNDQEPLLDSIKNLAANGWSLSDAIAYSASSTGLANVAGTPPTTLANDQVSALRDFLSLYAITQSDGMTQTLTAEIKNTTATNLFGGLINGVLIGGKGDNQNPYKNINAILDKLGIVANASKDHHNHFHLYLKVPTLQGIQGDLLIESHDIDSATDTLAMESKWLQSAALTMINGEELMFAMDVPYIPEFDEPVVIAQVAQSEHPVDYILEACHETFEDPNPRSAVYAVLPAHMLSYHLRKNDLYPDVNPADIKVTVLQSPSFGKLTDVIDNLGHSWYRYAPNPGYLGEDRAIFMAKYGGKAYKIILDIKVLVVIDERNPVCPDSIFLEVPKSGEVSSDNHTGFNLDLSNVTFADLESGALGHSNALGITLDDNANGYGWYVDLTPGLNEEFLPTANPYEWKAAPGSEAEGKIDLLTVLLHEAAHTLGHDHTLDGHALMAPTLEPGVRRLPSPELLAELQGLAEEYAQAEEGGNDPAPMPNPLPFAGLSAFWFGRTRKGEYGSILDAVGARTDREIQYAVTPNPTLLNPEFAAVDGWNITGDVALGGNAAVLRESAKSQTRLNQLFVLGEHDRFLRFTLDNINLDDVQGSTNVAGDRMSGATDVNAAPDDAFEVALIDANTNQSLLSSNGLGLSDGAINLQADGTEHLAVEVTSANRSIG